MAEEIGDRLKSIFKGENGDEATGDDEPTYRPPGSWLWKLILVLVVVIIIVILLIQGFVVVPAGHKGVIVTGPGGPDYKEIDEGWSWNPAYAVSDIEIIRYNTQTRDMTSSTASSVTVRSSDNLDIRIDLSLIYRLPPDKVADIRIDHGDHTFLIDRFMRNTPRNVASNYTGEFIGGEGRVVFEGETFTVIRDRLAMFDIEVVDLLVRSVDLPQAVDVAIEQKKAAEQAVITAQFLREAVVIQARANASKAEIEALGFANATVIRANGTAEAINRVIAQLRASDPGLTNATEAYLTLLYLQALVDPDSNIDFIIITDGGNPIIIETRPP